MHLSCLYYHVYIIMSYNFFLCFSARTLSFSVAERCVSTHFIYIFMHSTITIIIIIILQPYCDVFIVMFFIYTLLAVPLSSVASLCFPASYCRELAPLLVIVQDLQ